MDLETRKRAVDVIAQLVVGGSDKGYFTVLDELLDMIGYESLERERDLWRTKYEAIRAERDKALPYAIDPQQQTCKVCGRPMKIDFHVPDTLWKMVVPEKHHNHATCLYCFDEYANQAGVEYAIDDICFAGKAIRLRLTDAERERDYLDQRAKEGEKDA